MAQTGAGGKAAGASRRKCSRLAKVEVEAVRMPVTRRVPIGRLVDHVGLLTNGIDFKRRVNYKIDSCLGGYAVNIKLY